MKILLSSIVFIIFVYLLIGDKKIESYQNIFSDEFDNFSFYNQKYNEIGKKSVIIPVYQDKPVSSFTLISDEWISRNGGDPENIKSELARLSNLHVNKGNHISLTAQIITFDNFNIVFCLVYDKYNSVSDMEYLKKIHPYEYFLIIHEVEHCSVATNVNSLISKNRVFSQLQNIDDEEYKEKLFFLYSNYLQELYADLSALYYLKLNYPDTNWTKILAENRREGYLKGDYFHYSNDIVKEYFGRNVVLSGSSNFRDNIFDFVSSEGTRIKPIHEFRIDIKESGVYLPQ